jgi:tubulin polyglutamylase TTLL1
MYGYDVLIEENLKPWLIEVNSSPSLLTTTDADYKMKKAVLDGVFSIVVPP